MQGEVERHWERVVREDRRPPRMEDFGFNLPVDYVLETAQIYVQSGFVVMPEPGGWNDQDEAWCKDMLTYLRGRAWAADVYNEERKASEGNDGSSEQSSPGKYEAQFTIG